MPNNFTSSPFDAIRRFDQIGNEYWSARELAKILTYDNHRNFLRVIDKAKISCEGSGQAPLDHFVGVDTMLSLGSGAKRRGKDYRLSRYACYLIALNADPAKEIVAQAKTYFAIQTRRQELADELQRLPQTEETERIEYRGKMRFLDNQLKGAVHNAGAEKPKDYAEFFDSGYKGLYGGETENAIHKRKRLKNKEKILDHMGSEELGANIFRATQTNAKLRREKPQSKELANDTHYEVGKKVRQTIEELGGTMPEDLPAPEKSIQQLEKERDKEIQKFLHRQEQPLLAIFDETNEIHG